MNNLPSGVSRGITYLSLWFPANVTENAAEECRACVVEDGGRFTRPAEVGRNRRNLVYSSQEVTKGFFQEEGRKASAGEWWSLGIPDSATTTTMAMTYIDVHTLDDVREKSIHWVPGASRCIHNDRFVTTRPSHPFREPQAWPIDWSIDRRYRLFLRGRRRGWEGIGLIGERSAGPARLVDGIIAGILLITTHLTLDRSNLLTLKIKWSW